MDQEPPPAARQEASLGMLGWLREQAVSLVCTTYQTHHVMFIGRTPEEQLWAHRRPFPRCMAVYADRRELWLAGANQVWHFADIVPPGMQHEKGYDRVYAPRLGFVTGRLDVHELALDRERCPLFVNTRYSCLAALSPAASFVPLWQPRFISKLVPEDRCHLNGLAMEGGRPRFVTAISRADVVDGWRERRQEGGLVIEVASGEILTAGLSMPHSPRLYDGRLWLLNSGTGEFGTVDLASGRFEPVCFCPGFARGLDFVGRCAVIGLSEERSTRAFADLPLGRHLQEKDAEGRCGVLVVDLDRGAIVQWLRFHGDTRELYDVKLIQGTRQPRIIAFDNPHELNEAIVVGMPARPDDACAPAAA